MVPYNKTPWDDYDKQKFGVAVNGKALHFLIQYRSKFGFTLQSVLKKAQVYARMSPDDKADLVELLQDNMKV